MKRLELVVRNANPHDAEVLIDGEPVLVERVELDVRGDAFPRAKVTFIPEPLKIDVTGEDDDMTMIPNDRKIGGPPLKLWLNRREALIAHGYDPRNSADVI